MLSKNKKITHAMILLIGVMVFIFNPLHLFSQSNSILDSVITYKAHNISIYNGLNEIGDIVGYEFSYNADLFESRDKIKANYEEIALHQLLSNFLNDTTLTYYVSDKQIVIRKKNLLNTISSQNTTVKNKIIQISATIYGKDSGDYLPYTNISILGKSMGTVSNDMGNFNLKIPENNIIDTLVISYIGYKNNYIPIKQLISDNNKIYLEKDKYQIKEVIIRTNKATDILNSSLEKIKDNYYTDPYYITSFYREIVTSKSDLVSLAESVLKVYKSPYSGFFSDQIKIEKSRKNEFYTNEDTLSFKLKGGLYASLYLDIIKYPTNFLYSEFFHLFDYQITEIVNFDNNLAYVISFKPRSYIEDNSLEGNIYINIDNLAIVAVEYNITTEAIEKLGSSLILRKTFRTKVEPISVKYLINYRKINNKYYMNLARGELMFKVKYKRNLFATEFKSVFEFAVNDIDTNEVKRLNRVETIDAYDVFIDESFEYDNTFWSDYNYISPNETIEEALKKIEKKIKNTESEK